MRAETILLYFSHILGGIILSVGYLFGIHALFIGTDFGKSLTTILPELLLVAAVFWFFLHISFTKEYKPSKGVYVVVILLLCAFLGHTAITIQEMLLGIEIFSAVALIVPLFLAMSLFLALRVSNDENNLNQANI